MSRSMSKKEKSDRLFGRSTSRQQYAHIIDAFNEECQRNGLALPQKVFNEFEKRMKAPDTSKSKLDLRDCSFNESHVEILFKILEESRSVLKVVARLIKVSYSLMHVDLFDHIAVSYSYSSLFYLSRLSYVKAKRVKPRKKLTKYSRGEPPPF